MADPFTLTAISLAATAAGGAVAAGSKVMAGQSQAGAYQYQAGVAQVNQKIAKENADYARYTGEFEAQRSGMKTRFERAQTLTTQSGRGIDISSGSAAEVRDSITDLGKQDQGTIRASAARRAYGYDVEAEKQGTAAQMYGKAASRSKTASYIDAFGSLLGTAASVSGKWLQAGQAGVFGGGGNKLGDNALASMDY